MSTRDRRRTRNRLYLVGVLPALLMLLVSGRIGLLLVEQAQGLSAFDSEQYDGARGDFAANQLLNPFEQWIAHFDEGASLHRDGELSEAVSAYERALDEDVPADWECRVRNNLALAHEELGDAALKDRGQLAAEDEWLAGRAVLARCVEGEAEKRAVDQDERSDATDPDSDGDGVVSAEEAEAAAQADADGDGVVSAEEAEAASDPDADSNGDGDVSPDEQAAADAQAADVDRDGAVSAEESSVVIDDRLADKLADRDPPGAEDAEDPPPADATVSEREERLADRNRRALEQRRLDEQRRESRRDKHSNSQTDQPLLPEW